MSTTTEETVDEAIRLFTQQDEDGQVDAMVPIRWCISRETAERIQRMAIDSPQLVIVVEHSGKEMDRYIVPLEAQMRYIQFRRPGKNVVHATVMWPRYGESVKKHLTSRYDRTRQPSVPLIENVQPGVVPIQARYDELHNRFWRAEEEDDTLADTLRAELDQVTAELNAARASEPTVCLIRNTMDEVARLSYEARLTVVVPDEMFAKTPPRWMNWLGTRYTWSYTAVDQCDLRKRALITLFTLPFFLVIKWAAAAVIEVVNLTVCAVLLFFGMRNLNFEPLRRPFEHSPMDIGLRMRPSFWWTKEPKEKWRTRYELRHPVLLVLNPPTILGIALVVWGLYAAIGSLVFTILGGVALAAVALTAIGFVISRIEGPVSRWNEKRTAAKTAARQRDKTERSVRAKEVLRRDLEQLTCSTASRQVKVSALPKEHQTIHLRFQDLKSKVCRPFAR